MAASDDDDDDDDDDDVLCVGVDACAATLDNARMFDAAAVMKLVAFGTALMNASCVNTDSH